MEPATRADLSTAEKLILYGKLMDNQRHLTTLLKKCREPAAPDSISAAMRGIECRYIEADKLIKEFFMDIPIDDYSKPVLQIEHSIQN